MNRLSDCFDLNDISVELSLPCLGKINGRWQPDENERQAAWEMYVELVTRISVTELDPDEGLLRDVLSSLNDLFAVTRGILRQYGPVVARPKGDGSLSFGYLAVAVLNTVLRPLLSHWHPLLLDYANRRPTDVSAAVWESAWEHNPSLRRSLAKARRYLISYAELLADAAGVPSLAAPSSEDRGRDFGL